MESEIPLEGGRVTKGVVRVGNTVRRPPTFNSPFEDIEPDLQRRRLTMFCKAYDANVDLSCVVESIVLRQRILVAQGRRLGDTAMGRWAAECLEWTISKLRNIPGSSDANKSAIRRSL